MKVGDLLMYGRGDDEEAIGLCLFKTTLPACDADYEREVMRVLWFDDWRCTNESPLDEDDLGYMEILSEGR